MNYMGSKRRIAKHILPIILHGRKPDQYYVEPFVGGCNMIDKVSGLRIGGDSNYYLIEMWKAVQNGWLPPKEMSEEEYKDIKNNKDKYDPWLVGYTGFALSFGGKWFGGYMRPNEYHESYQDEAYRNMMKQVVKIKSISFHHSSYCDLPIPDKSIIYCDIPYKDTTKYKNEFDHDLFFKWALEQYKNGHRVFISEYDAPNDFVCVWEKEITTTVASDSAYKKATERLFVPKGMPVLTQKRLFNIGG